MDLRRLRHFEALYRLKSFARAADEVGLSQSALSRSVQKLEQELGCRLFDRTTHAVAATDSARRLAPLAEEVIAAAGALHDEAQGLQHPFGGVVRVGAGPYPLHPLLTDAVAAFGARHPSVRVTLTGGPSETLLQGLLDRTLDLVVCDRSKFEASSFAHDIVVHPLPPEPLVLVFAMGHPLASGVGRPDTTAYPWALPRPAPGSEARFAPGIRTRLAAGAFPQYELDSTAACLEVVRQGVAITAVPLSLAQRAAATGELAYTSLPRTSRTEDGVHLLKGRSRTAAVSAFVQEVRETAHRLSAASGRPRTAPAPSP